MINISFTKATVLLSEVMDVILLDTDLPCTFVKEFLPSQPNAQFELKATYNTGIQYCRDHLGIEPEVINTRK